MPADDAHLIEKRLQGQQVYRGDFLDVRRDLVALPDGHTTSREYVVHPGAVMIVALRDDGQIVVERQFRYPMGRAMLEFPAGKLDPGEVVFDCAVRELAEETGYRAGLWARAGVLHPVISYSTEFIEVWFARDLVPGPSALDAGEHLEVLAMSQEALEEAARCGALTDAKTLVGLLWLQQWRAGRWELDWRPLDTASPPLSSKP